MPKHSFLGARAFDAGLAALAALSAGFVAFAMPQPLFTGLVEASRLPDFVAAAQPPLGETARFAAVAAAAFLTFAAVWALMAVLGRMPAGARAEAEPDAEAPRLRRADAHPDAPARRPLLARDLGEPLDLQDFPEAPAEAAPALPEAEARPLPAFLVPQAPEEEPIAEAEPEPGVAEPRWAEPEPHWEAPRPEWTDAGAEPQAEEEPLPISELAAQLPEAEEDPDQSLAQMVNRIEFGLSRKRQALAADDQPAVEQSPAEEEKVGHRLRSAINDLQKIASSGG
ncbi:MAG TPA: hypothetical protein VEW26_05930 [Allosphingosinicella sp.]|nr:hypothetical protein [Allosphingosinicella sp.]